MNRWPGMVLGKEHSAIMSYYAEQLQLNLPLTRYELNDARKKVVRFCDQLALTGFDANDAMKFYNS